MNIAEQMAKTHPKSKQYLWLLALAILTYLAGSTNTIADAYANNIYTHIQALRHWLPSIVGISVGDVMYAGVVVGVLIVSVSRLARLKRNKRSTYNIKLISILKWLMGLFVIFQLGWGINYGRTPLAQKLALINDTSTTVSDSAECYAFAHYLIRKINMLAPYYSNTDLKTLNTKAISAYENHAGLKNAANLLGTKATLFGHGMKAAGIDGYFNPFSGEGQVVDELPGFMLPFTVLHEMAHQAGIAAEGDANLVAYIIGSNSDDTCLQYSTYMNLWLYTLAKVRHYDSTHAKQLKAALPTIAHKHLKELRIYNESYNNTVGKVSSWIFDRFLKLQQQKDGIKDYTNVVNYAARVEQKRRIGMQPIPFQTY